MLRVWDAIEHSALEHAVAEAIAHGFNEDDVRRAIETRVHTLAAGRSRRLETARRMLEAGATNLH
jgi:hypothetical protein